MEPSPSDRRALSLSSSLRRHLRSVARFWSSSLAIELEYQMNWIVELVAVLGTLAGSVFTLSLFYGHGQRLGGWSWNGALVVLGLYSLFEGFSSTLLRPNLGNLVKQVQTGSLDFVLLKPIDAQVWLSLRSFSPWGLPEMVLGLVVAAVGLVRSAVVPTPLQWLSAAVLLLCGATILYSLWFVLAATSIWFVKVWNATEVLRSLLAAGRYPVQAYPPGLRAVLSSVVPVAFLTTVPAEALLGKPQPGSLLAAVTLALVCLAGSRALWWLALRHYTSASS